MVNTRSFMKSREGCLITRWSFPGNKFGLLMHMANEFNSYESVHKDFYAFPKGKRHSIV